MSSNSLVDALIATPIETPVNHLDLTSLQELPDSFKWSKTDISEPLNSDPVPVIDLLEPNAVEHIVQACKTWGVFQVTNHGIPNSLFDRVESISKTFFSLPLDEKLKVARPSNGASGYGFARIAQFFSTLMWFEGFTIVGSPLEHFCELWPYDYSKYCDIIDEYKKEMQKLAIKMMWLMLDPLGITREDISWASTEVDTKEVHAPLQLNYYPVCPEPDQAMGLGEHTDTCLLTILYQNNVSGLEVYKEATGWVTVQPVTGGLVVNMGDLIHIVSNGLYPSVLHRAKVNQTANRISIAYLYGPPTDTLISPISKLVGPNQAPLYRSVTWGEYLGVKAKYFNKALSWIKVDAPLNSEIDDNDQK